MCHDGGFAWKIIIHETEPEGKCKYSLDFLCETAKPYENNLVSFFSYYSFWGEKMDNLDRLVFILDMSCPLFYTFIENWGVKGQSRAIGRAKLEFVC